MFVVRVKSHNYVTRYLTKHYTSLMLKILLIDPFYSVQKSSIYGFLRTHTVIC